VVEGLGYTFPPDQNGQIKICDLHIGKPCPPVIPSFSLILCWTYLLPRVLRTSLEAIRLGTSSSNFCASRCGLPWGGHLTRRRCIRDTKISWLLYATVFKPTSWQDGYVLGHRVRRLGQTFFSEIFKTLSTNLRLILFSDHLITAGLSALILHPPTLYS
jgi:hypothetical protein